MGRLKVDFFLVVILIIGLASFILKCLIAYPIDWIGNTDSAVFTETADSFLHGKGLSNDFIQYSYFYSPLQYPEITQPEAHYPHLYSLFILPFYIMLGKTAFAAKLPAILVVSIFLPILLYFLTQRLSRSKMAGLAAAIGIIVFPNIFEHSLIPDDDEIFHCLVIASCFFIIKAMDSPKYFYSAGVLIGLSYYGAD